MLYYQYGYNHILKGADFLDIAALSTSLSQMQIAQEASTSVMKLAMKTTNMQSDDLSKLMEQATTPHLGANIDIRL